jgi:pentapeptide MXKDX repeat protein
MRARVLLPLATAAVAFGLALAPAASAMDKMEKSSTSKSHSGMKNEKMGKKGSTSGGGMKKDSMGKTDNMSSDGMKK